MAVGHSEGEGAGGGCGSQKCLLESQNVLITPFGHQREVKRSQWTEITHV